MKIRFVFIVFAGFVLTAPAANAVSDGDGVLIGNGGDSIFCSHSADSAKFQEDGFYVLDYAASFHEAMPLAKIPSLQASFDRIEALLAEKAPETADSFRDFRAAIKDGLKPTATRKWIASEVPLQNIKDEYARLLPKNCRFKRPDQKFYGIYQQTVIRKRHAGHIEYIYDAEYMADYLGRPDATQASVLFVHEWLWDYYDHDPRSAPRIRSANAFLHSEQAAGASAELFHQRVFSAPFGKSKSLLEK